jgi:hypothetical protein
MPSQGMEVTETACGVQQGQSGLVAGSMSGQLRGRAGAASSTVSIQRTIQVIKAN